MRRLKNYNIVLAVLLLFSMFGCDSLFDTGDTEKAYDGPPQVAFFPLVRQFSVGTDTLEVRQTWVEVQLIGPQRGSDLTVSFEVLPEYEIVDGDTVWLTAAEAGVHYDFATGSPVVIPANTSVDTIFINTYGGSIPVAGAAGQTPLVIEITGTDAGDVVVAENLKRHTLNLRR